MAANELPISMQYSISVHYMRLVTDYSSSHGLSPEVLLERAGANNVSMSDPNDRVPYAHFLRVCEVAAEILGDPCFGLSLGMSVEPGYLGSHGVALMTCSTASEAIQHSARYSALTIDVGHNVFERRGNECIRFWRSNLPGFAPLGRLQDELQQAAWVSLGKRILNRDDLKLNWVSFRHERPADIGPYEKIFRCPLRFGQAETAISFDANLLDLPLPYADEKLRRIMDDLCAQLLKQLGSALEPAWFAVARKALLESFRGEGGGDISIVAKATGLSEFRLKEELSERGLSFRAFVDDLRRSLALGYIRDPKLHLLDVAYLLGFSEQSAFQRAFKRWTGATPGDYRRNSLSRNTE